MIVFRLLGLLFDLFRAPSRFFGRRTVPGTWLEVTVDGPVVDVLPKPSFLGLRLRAEKALSLARVDELVTKMIAEPNVAGLLVTLKSMKTGMAGASSLRAILARARRGGKEVVVYLPVGGDTKDVYVASVASKVLLGPSAQLAPLGFRAASRYYKRALDKAGVEPQVFSCGEFKSAGETLVRESMSEPQREQVSRLLETFHATVVDAIASGRALSRDRAVQLVDEGPFFGRAAVEAKLADDVAYEDEVQARIGSKKRPIPGGAWLLARAPLFRSIGRKPIIAVIPIHGAITHAGGALGGISTDERVNRMIRLARKNPRVKGVILHIDTPGGSALASDLMHHEIAQLGREKPVVACMANVAASGGYYVAAPAKRIVAQPTTITGSIGVVAARVSLEPLLAKLGIRTEVVARGARSALLGGMGPLDEDDRRAIQRELDAMYNAFVNVVATGRGRPVAEIEPLARGRVYTGKDALDLGLVDALGGFDVALTEMHQLAPGTVGADVVVMRAPRGHVDLVDPPKQAARMILGAVLPERERLLVELAAGGERALALSLVEVP